MNVHGLHVLTDARAGRDALAVVSAAAGAGAQVVQVRVKGHTDADLYDFASRVMEICVVHGTTCVVNDRVDIALAVGAHGTHLGAEDLPIAVVRRLAGPGHLIGGTAREPAQAARQITAGADYVGVGPAYPTTTKDGLPTPIGVEDIAAVARAVNVPVIAIGGITEESIVEIRATGAAGLAVVSAISDAPDPGAATRAILAAWRDDVRNGPR
jgi:thiamine-phosphate pyrophosphorylase